jgi:hypothetical protein
VMLARWTRILPHFIVVWLAKRYAERVEAVPGYYSSNPYQGEILSWPKQV